MSPSTPHGLTDGATEELLLDFLEYMAAEGHSLTLLDINALLIPRLGERGLKPTATQITDAVGRLLADGRLIDLFDRNQPGSKHYLQVAPKGLFK